MGPSQLILPLLILLFFTNGCAHYWYFGTKQALDSAGESRQVLAYWNRTERIFWFDTVAGAVRVKTQCGSTVAFEEKADGIIFRAGPGDQGTGGRTVPIGGMCGRILDAAKVGDLKEGELRLEIQCEPKISDFSLPSVHYLKAGRHNIQILRERRSTDNPPDVKACNSP